MADTAVQTTPGKVEIDEAKIQEYIRVSGLDAELTDNEKRQFVHFCVSYQLDPFKGEVHCSVYGQGEYRNMSLIVGFLTYVKRAELSGRLDGWSADIEGTGEDTEGVVRIWRKDWSHPFEHRVHWKEAVQRKRDGSLTAFWKKMPRYLLKKTAIAQAFRLAFPAELAGMGYDEAELPEEMTQPVGTGTTDQSPAEPSTTEKPKAVTSRKRATPGKNRTDRQTIPFPSGKPKGNGDGGAEPDERTNLENAIRQMLKTNGLAFPKAHTEWIDRELAKKPSKDRLEQIIEHMQSVIGTGAASETETDQASSEADHSEELIF